MEFSRSADSAGFATFQKVISDTVQLELERAGLLAMSESEINDPTGLNSIELRKGVEQDALYEFGRKNGADFVLASLFSITGSVIEIEFSWYDVSERRLSARIAKRGRIDLALDVVISAAMEEILKRVESRLAGFSRRSPAEKPVEAGERQARSRETGDKQSGAPEGAGSGTEGQSGLVKGGLEQGEAVEKVEETGKRDYKRFEFTLGFAPFLTIGEASDYFKLGISPYFYAGYRFLTPAGLVALGIHAGFNRFDAQGNAASSSNFLIPLGGDIRFIMGYDSLVGIFFRAAGGAALFTVNVEGAGSYSKFIPYAWAGIGINLNLSPAFGVAVEASYAVFFEGAFPIMGFTPSVNLSLRL
ncbi:MAG TPA: hypothetical protein VMX75_15480 [Spirochaetia bacterium]|nr:hypothetical protein [Spirochaetia bacterium]